MTQPSDLVGNVNEAAGHVILAAISEVFAAYEDGNMTQDGVIDVGDNLQALGELIGLDLRADAKRIHEDTYPNGTDLATYERDDPTGLFDGEEEDDGELA